ncbi:MAG: hypothetical protein PHS93_00055 [Candidatus Omnitrophica bacterium]|nr:hypothetical protein [Candidatus Omnitrophota bacterium]MDD5351554.1 hypothetical protein [Candidatus Omnitrophota bacterium]MDD5550989.1 hypothetical protein [Candidatus Omnitrophota bacterium]
MIRFLNKRAQNTAEYAILIGVIVAAAIAMQIYVRRGMQARIKDAMDYSMTIGNETGEGIFTQSQYEPYYMESNMSTASRSDRSEAMEKGGQITRDITNEYTARTGQITYGNWSEGND